LKKYYFPLVTGILIGLAFWLVDSAIAVMTINDLTVMGAVLTGVSMIRLSVRFLVLLVAGLIGGYKAYALYQQEQRQINLAERDAVNPIAENFRRKSVRNRAEGEVEKVVRRERKTRGGIVAHSGSAHSRMVWQYAFNLGESLGLSDDELLQLQAVCYFHDIGRLILSDDKMEQHAEVGARVLEGVGGLEPAAEAVRQHHERYNGSGKNGLRAQDIPLLSRIFSVAWVYHALTRPTGAYHLSNEEALEMLYAYSGTALDPELVSVFIGRNGRGRVFVDQSSPVFDR